jgi:MFS transporter, FHS family, glucose/mannose:H+ symporter
MIAAGSFTNRWTLSSVVVGAGFCLTGAGTVMLGVLLPTLSLKWGMRDDAAGFLLFLQFLGSSLGAILTGTKRIRTITMGYGLLVASAGALAFADMQLSFVIFFLYGMGLGMAMTATSLLISDRYGDDRAAKLERLNFAWAAGATAAPLLCLPFLRGSNLSSLFFTFQGLFLLLFIWVVVRERQDEVRAESFPDASQAPTPASTGALLPLVALATCAVGIEGSLSGWLTTYSHRADLLGTGGAALAASLFWFGIVLSRLAFSTRLLAMVGRRRLLIGMLWGVAFSAVLLVAAHSPMSIRLVAALAGFCIGPLYPLLLSFILQRSPKGWVFAVAGVGSAVLPWLTGFFSARLGSLRYGLIAPCGAAALMLALFAVSLPKRQSPALENSSDL